MESSVKIKDGYKWEKLTDLEMDGELNHAINMLSTARDDAEVDGWTDLTIVDNTGDYHASLEVWGYRPLNEREKADAELKARKEREKKRQARKLKEENERKELERLKKKYESDSTNSPAP
jgi:hypothetical protein